MRDGSPVGDPRVVKKPFGQTGLGRVDDSGRVFHTLITRANTGYLGELDVTKTDARVENIQPVPTTPSPRDSPNNLDWSPDGTRIRIARFRSDSPMWIRDVATGREREIKPPEGYSYLPSATNWTPDGKSWVTILGGKDGKELKLAWADVDSGTFRIGRTLSQFWHQNPIQSPDGLHVYAVKHFPIPSDTRSLLRINVETGEEREICRGRGDMRVSPDFSHAACFNGDGIRLVSLTGGAERRLVNTNEPPLGMTWTPDGKFLIYWQSQPQSAGTATPSGPVAWIVPVAGGEPRRLQIPGGIRHFNFHPNGRQVVHFPANTSTELWVLENLKFD
jgi:Tol biopolymer transport system component